MTTAMISAAPWPIWPVAALWVLFIFSLRLLGRLLLLLVGFALMAVGVALTMTVVGAVVGLPLAAVGFLLLCRALF